ncbi:MAG: class I SAM-dependent methyltransferase [Alphaproteobacteria bacterium]
MAALYDTIGLNYADLRQPDPSIERAIHNALGDAATVVNVGAGCGSYEPSDRSAVAVELSRAMIRQRPPGAAPVVQATAMALPFGSDAFDAAMAILTVHHWPDKERGLEELRRVSCGRVVILTWDPSYVGFWLTDYFPEILDEDRRIFPMIHEYEHVLGRTKVIDVPVPYNCTDGFLCGYWRRPEAYLDQRVRSAISSFSKLGDAASGLQKLERDLKSGEWRSRYGDMLGLTEMNFGYRLIVAG